MWWLHSIQSIYFYRFLFSNAVKFATAALLPRCLHSWNSTTVHVFKETNKSYKGCFDSSSILIWLTYNAHLHQNSVYFYKGPLNCNYSNLQFLSGRSEPFNYPLYIIRYKLRVYWLTCLVFQRLQEMQHAKLRIELYWIWLSDVYLKHAIRAITMQLSYVFLAINAKEFFTTVKPEMVPNIHHP